MSYRIKSQTFIWTLTIHLYLLIEAYFTLAPGLKTRVNHDVFDHSQIIIQFNLEALS